MQKVTLIAACWIGLAAPAFCQGGSDTGLQSATAESANGEGENYQIVSIKPHKPGSDWAGMNFLSNGFEWRDMNMSLVQGAYGIIMDSQVLGLPEWARSDSYDIVAIADAATTARWKKLNAKVRMAEERLMMRAILADRCHFKAHQETRELPVYDLVVVRGGLKMKDALPNESPMEQMSAGKMMV